MTQRFIKARIACLVAAVEAPASSSMMTTSVVASCSPSAIIERSEMFTSEPVRRRYSIQAEVSTRFTDQSQTSMLTLPLI